MIAARGGGASSFHFCFSCVMSMLVPPRPPSVAGAVAISAISLISGRLVGIWFILLLRMPLCFPASSLQSLCTSALLSWCVASASVSVSCFNCFWCRLLSVRRSF